MNLLKRRKAMAKNAKFCLSVVLLVPIVLGLAVSAKVRAGVVLPPSPYSPLGLTTFIDEDKDGIDDNLEQYLANKFAPVILIESDESNYPVNVEWFLQRARLEYHEDCTSDVDDPVGPNPLMTQENLIGPPWGIPTWTVLVPEYTPGDGFRWVPHEVNYPHCGEGDTDYSHPPHHDITTVKTDPDGQWSVGSSTTGYSDQQTFVIPDLADSDQLGSTDPQEWVTYFHAYPTKDGGIMLQYWHLFAYNGLGIAGFGHHGGDWDATIHVQLDNNLQLKQVWFSRHSHDNPGDPIDRSRVTLIYSNTMLPDPINGTHPLMTIDGGGHAAFASPRDFCTNSSVAGGIAAWPTDMNDLLNPAKLSGMDGNNCVGDSWVEANRGGTIWETWEGGSVLSTPNWKGIPLTSGHGGMVNLGEYNPCGTPEGFNSTCYGSKQASTLLAGQFLPLNGQIFIAYEGRWGSLPHEICLPKLGCIPSGIPPRGPVFQGFKDNGEGKVSEYTAWYNEADTVPASPATTPWREAPTTGLTLTGLTSFDGTHNYISGATTASFIVDQNPVAASYGNPRTYYRIYPVGGVAPTFNRVSGAFALPAEPDGYYLLQYYSMDALNNQEMDNQGFPKVSSLVFTKLNKLNSTGVYFMAGGYRATASMDVSMTTPNLMPSGWLKFNYRTSTMTCYLSSTQLTEAWMLSDKKTMMIGGFATVNNQPGYYFWAGATDNGSPGAGLDQFSITVLDPQRKTFLYIPSTTISGGDLVIKPLY